MTVMIFLNSNRLKFAFWARKVFCGCGLGFDFVKFRCRTETLDNNFSSMAKPLTVLRPFTRFCSDKNRKGKRVFSFEAMKNKWKYQNTFWHSVDVEGLPMEQFETESEGEGIYLVQLFQEGGGYITFELARFFDGDEGLNFYGGRNGDELVEDKFAKIVAWQAIKPYQMPIRK